MGASRSASIYELHRQELCPSTDKPLDHLCPWRACICVPSRSDSQTQERVPAQGLGQKVLTITSSYYHYTE